MYQEIFKLHSDLLKALSHPKRLEIIQLLRNQTLNVSRIQTMLGLSQSNLSQHLTVLKEAGVVTGEKQGKKIFYQLTHPNFVKASDLLRQILIERHQNGPLANELTYSMQDLVPIISDPVCNMRLSPKTASYAHQHQGQQYYFCARGCLKEFRRSPEKYINQNKKE